MGIMNELFTASKGSRGGRRGDVVSVAPQAQYADAQPAEAWSDPAQQEQAAFEQAIDANPLNPVTHGVYADWLQEHGQDDEAAFRRAMGDWAGQHGKLRQNEIEALEKWPENSEGRWYQENPWGVYEHRKYTGEEGFLLPTTDYPQGVRGNLLPPWRADVDQVRRSGFHAGDTRLHDRSGPYYTGKSWLNYRSMEGAFRHAFMQNLQRQREQQPNDVQPS